jgi:hypothetical protein
MYRMHHIMIKFKQTTPFLYLLGFICFSALIVEKRVCFFFPLFLRQDVGNLKWRQNKFIFCKKKTIAQFFGSGLIVLCKICYSLYKNKRLKITLTTAIMLNVSFIFLKIYCRLLIWNLLPLVCNHSLIQTRPLISATDQHNI